MRVIKEVSFPHRQQKAGDALQKVSEHVWRISDVVVLCGSWHITITCVNVIIVAKDVCSHSFSRRLWDEVLHKVFECTDHSTKQNSSSVMFSVWAECQEQTRCCVIGVHNFFTVYRMSMIVSEMSGCPWLMVTLWREVGAVHSGQPLLYDREFHRHSDYRTDFYSSYFHFFLSLKKFL